MLSMRLLAIIGLAVLVVAAGGCEQPAEDAPARAPDVPFEATPHHIVAEMLRLAGVAASDVVYDLGCGDGRIVIAAARLGARAVCVDIDPRRIRESRANARRAGVEERIAFLTEDFFQTNIAGATVVTLFLFPGVNERLCSKLWKELRPGARVVAYAHGIGYWRPQETSNVEASYGPRKVFLWIMPADKAASAHSCRTD